MNLLEKQLNDKANLEFYSQLFIVSTVKAEIMSNIVKKFSKLHNLINFLWDHFRCLQCHYKYDEFNYLFCFLVTSDLNGSSRVLKNSHLQLNSLNLNKTMAKSNAMTFIWSALDSALVCAAFK